MFIEVQTDVTLQLRHVHTVRDCDWLAGLVEVSLTDTPLLHGVIAGAVVLQWPTEVVLLGPGPLQPHQHQDDTRHLTDHHPHTGRHESAARCYIRHLGNLQPV